MSDYHRLRDFNGNVIKANVNTDNFYCIRYNTTTDGKKDWYTVYVNNIMAAYKFAQFIQTRFGHAWIDKVEVRPDMFYESLEDLILGIYWKWDRAHEQYHKYKHAKCCMFPLSKADLKKDPSE